MAEPKKKRSKTRTRRDRHTVRTAPKQLTICGHCGAQIVSHRACPQCGFYKGAEVVNT